jgi:hypothetical protein
VEISIISWGNICAMEVRSGLGGLIRCGAPVCKQTELMPLYKHCSAH